MSVSVEDIDRWDSGDVREVFHATRSRAEAAAEASDGIADLPAFGTWGGQASEAANDAITRTRRDLDAHGQEALAVAQAASRAADDVDKVKADLANLRSEAERTGMAIDPIGNTVVAGPGSVGVSPMEVLLKQMELQPRLDAILAEAAQVDQELSRAVAMATGQEPIPDTPHTNDPAIQQALSKPLPEDPQQFNDLWDKLDQEEKDWLYFRDHSIGNHPGMPFVDKNHYNRLHLTDLESANQAEIDRLAEEHPNWTDGSPDTPNPSPPGFVDWKTEWDNAHREQQGYEQVRKSLESPDGLPRLLGLIDEQGHAAISINDPDTAIRNATYVPGRRRRPASDAAPARAPGPH